MPAAVRVAHPERQVVEQQRPARWPRAQAMRLEHDRREHLHPIHHQRPMAREAQLTGLRVDPQPPRPLARHPRRSSVRRAGADCHQRPGHPARDELILARCMRPLVELDVPLADLARVLPRLLTRQHLREAMRTIPVGRHALVVLAAMPRCAVLAIEANARPYVLGPRTGRLRFAPTLASRRHRSRRTTY